MSDQAGAGGKGGAQADNGQAQGQSGGAALPGASVNASSDGKHGVAARDAARVAIRIADNKHHARRAGRGA
ncbi:hypothetical protein L3067_15180 [Xanthomonas sp. PPL568]|uniref:hypothetical protein n=1 Tax=Xanthomonas indica TaxID=2912242 RepID=UPI001F5A3D12|nr:hypothetical protein [Xanthomonas indica]MCI2245950.1 hypothetical protein [Xanthomonas indica]